MSFIADILLIAGAFGAAAYCLVLSRRLRTFTNLEIGIGGAVAVLSAQVDDMTQVLEKAQKSAQSTSGTLDNLTDRAESAARRLELLVASMHDLPTGGDNSRPLAKTPNTSQIPATRRGKPPVDTASQEEPSSAATFLKRRSRIRSIIQ